MPDDINRYHVGKILELLITVHRKPIMELAETLDIDPILLINIERGTIVPPREVMEKVAAHYNIPVFLLDPTADEDETDPELCQDLRQLLLTIANVFEQERDPTPP